MDKKYVTALVFITLFGLPAAHAATSPFEFPVKLPPCSSSAANVKIIDDAKDWRDINSSTYTVFCVTPGDYTNAGVITLTADGTETKRRYIRYYDPRIGEKVSHPAKLAPPQRAKVKGFVFADADYWVIDGLWLWRSSTEAGAQINVPAEGGSSFNVLNRLMVEGGAYDGGSMIALMNRNPHWWVQNSYICSGAITPKKDTTAIQVSTAWVTILNNEICNVGDGVGSAFGETTGLRVISNHFYITPALYSNCRGARDPKGACACAENGIDLKNASINQPTTNADEMPLIAYNIFSGFRKTDPLCGGTGSHGDGIVLHSTGSNAEALSIEADYGIIKGNIFHNMPNGVAIANGADHWTVEDNLFIDLNKSTFPIASALVLKTPGNVIRNNTFWDSDGGRDMRIANGGARSVNNDFQCNVVRGLSALKGSLKSPVVANYNYYYGEPKSPNYRFDKGVGSVGSLNLNGHFNSSLKVLIYPYSHPTYWTIPDVVTTSSSPHANQCKVAHGHSGWRISRNFSVGPVFQDR